jgi:hypothetical protein
MLDWRLWRVDVLLFCHARRLLVHEYHVLSCEGRLHAAVVTATAGRMLMRCNITNTSVECGKRCPAVSGSVLHNGRCLQRLQTARGVVLLCLSWAVQQPAADFSACRVGAAYYEHAPQHPHSCCQLVTKDGATMISTKNHNCNKPQQQVLPE